MVKKTELDDEERAPKKRKKDSPKWTQDERKEKIRLAAYFRWEERGKQDGSHTDDWYEAEDSLTD